jgi:sec-independent protein translocase protein TatA
VNGSQSRREGIQLMGMIWGLGAGELLIIALVLLFFFGAKRIPEIARGVGGAFRNFKGEMTPPDQLDDPDRQPPEDRDPRRD